MIDTTDAIKSDISKIPTDFDVNGNRMLPQNKVMAVINKYLKDSIVIYIAPKQPAMMVLE